MLLLIAGSFLLLGCNQSPTKKEVELIAFELANLDSITDFYSNRNHPVPKVENIGEGLYKRLRKLNRNKLDHVDIQTIDTDKDKIESFGDGVSFKVTHYYTSKQHQRYFLFYSEREDIYKITGF